MEVIAMSTAETAKSSQAGAETTEEAGLLDKIVDAARPDDQMARARTRDAVQQFLDMVVKPGQVISKDADDNIKAWIIAIDKKLSAQVNEIMHDPAFQKLESTWRGLHYLVMQSETGDALKIRVLNVG